MGYLKEDTELSKARIKIRNSRLSDLAGLMKVEELAWDKDQRFTKDQIQSQILTFPEGHICAEVDGKICGFVVLQVMPYNFDPNYHSSWYEITDNGTINRSHQPDLVKSPMYDTVLYGVNLSVQPDAPKGASDAIIDSAAKLAVANNIRRVILGARMPYFATYRKKHSDVTASEYLSIIRNNHSLDPEIAFYERTAGVKILGVARNYFHDPDSEDYGVIIQWTNPLWNKWYLPFIKMFCMNGIKAKP